MVGITTIILHHAEESKNLRHILQGDQISQTALLLSVQQEWLVVSFDRGCEPIGNPTLNEGIHVETFMPPTRFQKDAIFISCNPISVNPSPFPPLFFPSCYLLSRAIPSSLGVRE